MALEHKIAIAQINPTVGDLVGNGVKIIQAIHEAKAQGAEIVVLPEQAVTGYPAHDLLLHNDFIQDTVHVNEQIALNTPDIYAIVGSIEPTKMRNGKNIKNVALVMHNGKIVDRRAKILLPTYDVFHELRYFVPGEAATPVDIEGVKYGIQICEDMWDDEYERKITKELVDKGAEAIINISASPYYIHKKQVRYSLMERHARQQHVPFVYCNMVGGQDELIFDGGSMVVDEEGRLIAQLPSFEESVQLIKPAYQSLDLPVAEEEVFQALTLGLRDYYGKSGLRKAVLGLSGGIDSALTCVIAAEALGKENVKGLALPSEYSSEGSITDAQKLAENLGIDFEIVPIKGMYDAAIDTLQDSFENKPFDVTEENLQARLRMMVLMAYSNKHGYTLLATGDKSEAMLGYTTIYGDMSGSIAVIQDLTKTEAYAVANWYNGVRGEVIPEATLTKPPSPELKPGQVAPFNYERISPMAEHLVNHVPLASIRERGFGNDEITETYRKFRAAEFKRWQNPITLKCKQTSFGKGRIYPIVNGYVPSALFVEEKVTV